MIINEKQTREAHVLAVANAIMSAARTAPKARGVDNLEIVTISGNDLNTLASHMHTLGDKLGYAFFHRDAENVLASEAVVLLGTKNAAIGLDCGLCGFEKCADKPARIPCAFNMNDLGIAEGSAASIAADHRVDSRIMFSAGRTAQEIGMIRGCHAVMALLLSCSPKSPYFDRVVK